MVILAGVLWGAAWETEVCCRLEQVIEINKIPPGV